jgi:hypothetical protein
MTNRQDTNSQGQAEPGEILKDVTQNKISSASEKDALGDSSLDEVSGGGWPFATTKTGTATPTI